MNKRDILSLTLPELTAFFTEIGEPAYRAKQVFRWLHVSRIKNFAEMLNLSAQIRAVLDKNFYITSLKIKKRLVSSIDDTVKYLYELPDGEYIESVLMRYHHGNSLCISTQVGCRMGCRFCASTIAGFVRNLTPSEILDQVYAAEQDSKEAISTIVIMGIGEPLDNYDHLLRFLALLSDPNGYQMSLRHVTVSTCGLVDRIKDLAEQKLALTLTVSLHAPNDEIRTASMPINQKWKMDQLLSACREYAEKTGRRVSFEYALVRDVNDRKEDALELAKRLKGMLCHVNLIPINEIAERKDRYRTAYPKKVLQFQQLLQQQGINTTVRRTLGSDINAACGQLRREAKQEGKEMNL